jgi:hypothetical protein
LAVDSWASNHDGNLNALRRVQGNLTVDLIMVRRGDFDTCGLDETAAQVKARNAKQFSYLPVSDSEGRILGLYNSERWFHSDVPDSKVGDDFEPLSEEILIGANASIVEFVMQADTHPTNLVVSGSRIEGLVSLSDIQQLPARAAIFTLITSLEMALAMAISFRWPDSSDWMSLLSPGRQAKLLEEIKNAERADGLVSEIAFTQLQDKATIVSRVKMLDRSQGSLARDFKAINRLRDDVAHANAYADQPERARAVCDVVRRIFQTKTELLAVIDKMKSQAE